MKPRWNDTNPKPSSPGVYVVCYPGEFKDSYYCYYDGKHWGRVRETEKAAAFSGARRGTEQNFFWVEIMATKK